MSASTTVFTTSSVVVSRTCACPAVAIVSSRTEFDITSSRPGERRSSCERAGDGRSQAGRYVATEKPLQIRLNGPDGHSTRYRPAAVGRARLRTSVSSPPTSSACAAWRRRETYPRPPAARSASESPPSTSSGTGTDDGPDVSTSGSDLARGPGRRFRSSRRTAAVAVPPSFPLPPWLVQSSAEPSALGSQPPSTRSPRSAPWSARVMTSSASTYGPMSSGIASIASS